MTGSGFPPFRIAARARLDAFLPQAGRDYAALRNIDPGPEAAPHVSALSPYLHTRLLTEAEVIASAVARHGAGADVFVREVAWRSYWKGWLEQHPSVWDEYRQAALQAPPAGYADAVSGRTGIACFDAWARELVARNWLHNHARMSFASIWCFTLRLPWALGADFFLRYLLDGDAASNTLSWRWVAGLQTSGKAYAASASAIAHCSAGRFAHTPGLADHAAPVPPCPEAPLVALRAAGALPGEAALLLHEDDMGVQSLDLAAMRVTRVGVLVAPELRSAGSCSGQVADWLRSAALTQAEVAKARFGVDATVLDAATLPDWLAAAGMVVAPWVPVGWSHDLLAAVAPDIHYIRRDWDSAAWPHATRGFFRFAKAIPTLPPAQALSR